MAVAAISRMWHPALGVESGTFGTFTNQRIDTRNLCTSHQTEQTHGSFVRYLTLLETMGVAVQSIDSLATTILHPNRVH